MAAFNPDMLETVLQHYAYNIESIRPKELYKWEATQVFQKEWNLEAQDFADMLQKALSKTGNLLGTRNWLPRRGIYLLATHNPEAIRSAFQLLFDNTKDHKERLVQFTAITQDVCDSLNRSLRETGEKEVTSDQDPRALSVYLALRYPDSHYLYKSTMYTTFAKRIGAECPSDKFEKPLAFKSLMDDVLQYIVSNHEELIEASDSTLSEDLCAIDPNHHIFVQDIAWFVDGWNEGVSGDVPIRSEFTWIPTYEAIADALVDYQHNQKHLCAIVEKSINERFDEMDPFTFFSMFNGKLQNFKKRDSCIRIVLDELGLKKDLPGDYSGVPVMNPTRWRFWGGDENQVETNWNMFVAAKQYCEAQNEDTRDTFKSCFDAMLSQKVVGNASITMGLYWMFPNHYLPLDKNTTAYLEAEFGIKVPNSLDGEHYLQLLEAVRSRTAMPFFEISHIAWVVAHSDGWWPSLAEYDPKISVDTWFELLNDPEVFDEKSLQIVSRIADLGGAASCADLAEEYGESFNYYNTGAQALARRVAGKLGKQPLNAQNAKWWPILFQGRYEDISNTNSRYLWRLREELEEALYLYRQNNNLPNTKGGDSMSPNRNTHKLNTILYGPPGTGKTYSTMAHAVAICDNGNVASLLEEMKTPEGYSSVKERYSKLIEEKRIAFTTFHQSYSYEDFIEGIRPAIPDDESQGVIQYVREPGVFKAFCERAETSTAIQDDSLLNFEIDENPTVWKVSLEHTGDNPTRTDCLEHNKIRIGWDEYHDNIEEKYDELPNPLRQFYFDMKKGDIVFSCYTQWTIDAIGVIADDEVYYDDSVDYYGWTRNVTWIKKYEKGKEQSIREINDGVRFTLGTVYRLNRISLSDVLNLIDEGSDYPSRAKASTTAKKYVFIIDEINRGNISEIFGETITLLEENKRIGGEEERKAILPYTKKEWGIPSNVYVLGTMNTADKSLTQIDTALRRRFSFVETMPEPGLLSTNIDSVDLQELLSTINKRIEALLDRDHIIGHSYFMKVDSMDDLQDSFANEIIPLLQEYFFDDYERIKAVLNDSNNVFIQEEEAPFIEEINIENLNTIYRINPYPSTWGAEAFRNIYELSEEDESE